MPLNWTGLASLLQSRWLLPALLMAALAIAVLRGNDYRADRDRWKSAHAAQASAFTAAASAARTKAEAARIATETHYATLARRADHEIPASLADARAAADRFAAARSLRPTAAGHPSGNAPAATPPDLAPDRDGPGADAVALSRAEFDQLVSNSIRLGRVREWAETLIRDGLAVPVNDHAAPVGPP